MITDNVYICKTFTEYKKNIVNDILNDAHLNHAYDLPQYPRVIHHDHHVHGLISARHDYPLGHHLISRAVHSVTGRVM